MARNSMKSRKAMTNDRKVKVVRGGLRARLAATSVRWFIILPSGDECRSPVADGQRRVDAPPAAMSAPGAEDRIGIRGLSRAPGAVEIGTLKCQLGVLTSPEASCGS